MTGYFQEIPLRSSQIRTMSRNMPTDTILRYPLNRQDWTPKNVNSWYQSIKYRCHVRKFHMQNSITNLEFVFKVILCEHCAVNVSVHNFYIGRFPSQTICFLSGLWQNRLYSVRNANRYSVNEAGQNIPPPTKPPSEGRYVVGGGMSCMLTNRSVIRATTPAAEKRHTYLLHRLRQTSVTINMTETEEIRKGSLSSALLIKVRCTDLHLKYKHLKAADWRDRW